MTASSLLAHGDMELASTSTSDRLTTVPPCKAISVLLLDDDDTFRNAVADSLRDDGHPVLECEAPSHVPPLAGLDQVALVVTDYQMPAGNGLAFADAFHAVHPTVPIVVVTAQSTLDLDAQAAVRSYVRLLRKPVDYDELHALLHRLLG